MYCIEYFLLCLPKITTISNTMIPNSSTTISPPTAPRTIASSCESDWDCGEPGSMSESVVVPLDVGWFCSMSVVVESVSSMLIFKVCGMVVSAGDVVVESVAGGVVVSAGGVVTGTKGVVGIASVCANEEQLMSIKEGVYTKEYQISLTCTLFTGQRASLTEGLAYLYIRLGQIGQCCTDHED